MAFLDEATWKGRIFAGGAWVPAAGGTLNVREPATGAVLGEVGLANPDDLAKAAESAAGAQKDWAATPHTQRSAVLRKAAQLWAQHAQEISWWNIREVGAVPGMAGFALHVAEQECYEAAALPSYPYGELLPSEEPRLSMARRVPAGVVGVISPFNVPIILGIRSVAPALALGNAVILKPDPRTAVTGGVVLARIFEEAGLPPGVLQMLPGGADVGQAMVTHPLVRIISFTGSTSAGRIVGELAGRHLKRAHLELGGNSAFIVLDDADVDAAVNLAAWGSFFHQGQICMTTGRHLVHERLYGDFVERLAAKAAALPVGDPARQEVALGPLIDARQRDRVHELVSASIQSGATAAAGGSYDGLFYAPTVLSGVTPSAPALTQEVFGPVAPVLSFSDIQEAVHLATASEYGLSLGIITRDVMKGLALADRIPTGIVHINDQTVSDEANSPFGGVGMSGTGARFGGAAANIEAFTETRWVTVRGEPAETSLVVKLIDRRHLLSLGTIGGGQCGTQETEYQDVHRLPTIDLCEVHDYQPAAPIPGDQFNGMQVRLDQCRALNKPLFVGETGIRPTDVGGTPDDPAAALAARAAAFDAKLGAQFPAGVTGVLAWAWSALGSTTDNYDIGPGDPTLTVLGRY